MGEEGGGGGETLLDLVQLPTATVLVDSSPLSAPPTYAPHSSLVVYGRCVETLRGRGNGTKQSINTVGACAQSTVRTNRSTRCRAERVWLELSVGLNITDVIFLLITIAVAAAEGAAEGRAVLLAVLLAAAAVHDHAEAWRCGRGRDGEVRKCDE